MARRKTFYGAAGRAVSRDTLSQDRVSRASPQRVETSWGESAPVVLLGNDLRTVAETLRIARRCRRIIMTNFVGTLLVDCVGVALAALGLLAPLLAAFVHVASELAFILNSARLLPTASNE